MGRRGSHGACGWGINPAARHPLRLRERLPGVARAWYGAHTGRGHAESTQTPPAGDTPGTSSLERAVTSPQASCEQPELFVGTGLGSLPFPQVLQSHRLGVDAGREPRRPPPVPQCPCSPGLCGTTRAGGSSVNESWRWGGGVIFPKTPRCKRASHL